MFKNQTWQFITSQLKNYWKATLGGTCLLVLTNALWYFLTNKINHTVNELIKNQGDLSSSFWWALALISLMAVSMALVRLGSRIVLFGVGRQIESEQRQKCNVLKTKFASST